MTDQILIADAHEEIAELKLAIRASNENGVERYELASGTLPKYMYLNEETGEIYKAPDWYIEKLKGELK